MHSVIYPWNAVFYLAITLTVWLLNASCTRDNEEDLFGEQKCIIGDVRYTATIAPIMQQHCNTCHTGTAPPANVITGNYTSLREVALDGRLLGSVKHLPGFEPMPFGLPQLDECLILRIETWVLAGAPDN